MTAETRSSPYRLASRTAQASARSGSRVEHGDVLGALVEQAVADGDAGAAGADQRPPGRRTASGSAARKARAVAGPVGVAAQPPAVAEDHGVDRAQVGGVVGELVEQRHHRLLERVGDVEAVEAEPLRPGEQVGQVVGAEAAAGRRR